MDPKASLRKIKAIFLLAVLLAALQLIDFDILFDINDFGKFSPGAAEGTFHIIALDGGLLQGPANTVFAAQRALAEGANALNVDLVLIDGDLLASHNATHQLPLFGVGSFPQLSRTDWSPSCQVLKHLYLQGGFLKNDVKALRPCKPQTLNTASHFLENFPEIPMTFDLKSVSFEEQLLSLELLHTTLERFHHRTSDTVAVRFFAEPIHLLKLFDATGKWKWPHVQLAIGSPVRAGTDAAEALDVLATLPRAWHKAISAVYVTPNQLNSMKQRLGTPPALSLICDLGNEELVYRFHNLSEVIPLCQQSGIVGIHTGRTTAVANFLQNGPRTTSTTTTTFPLELASRDGMTVIGQGSSNQAVQFLSTDPVDGITWTRCAGKLATSLLVLRLVDEGLLPGLDEPIMNFLNISGRWFPDWQDHPVMKNLTLRHVMAGVGGLRDYRFTPDWATSSVRSTMELAERSLSLVNRSFELGKSYNYSNLQWTVVELAVERASGLDFPEAARRFLFAPLGISDSYYRSEEMPPCNYNPSQLVMERNLRAGIGLCATADDLFLLGITLRRSCRTCFLSSRGFEEVMMDQLAVNFPVALPSFRSKSPATDFAAAKLPVLGRGFGGFHLGGGWFLAHGGRAGHLGQNVLIQTAGSSSSSGAVLVIWISREPFFHRRLQFQTLAQAVVKGFMENPEGFNAGDVFSANLEGYGNWVSLQICLERRENKSNRNSNRSTRSDANDADCQMPFPHFEDPTMAASFAEKLYRCRGLAANSSAVDFVVQAQQKHCRNVSIRSCSLGSCVKDEDKEEQGRLIRLCRDPMPSHHPQKLCERMAACSSTWNMMNDRNEQKLRIAHVVRAQHALLLNYSKVVRDTVGLPECMRFAKNRSKICGGLQRYTHQVNHLEPLFPDLRNLWFHEFNVSDFTPYLPLPALPNFSLPERTKKVLIVAGANKFCRVPKYFVDMYSPYFSFDEIHLLNTNLKDPPLEVRSKIIQRKVDSLKVGTRNDADLVHLLPSMVKEEDFVVLMWDVDTRSPATLDWGFMADLLSQNLSFVDELYIKLHFQTHHDQMATYDHSPREAYELLQQLRFHCRFAVHAWP